MRDRTLGGQRAGGTRMAAGLLLAVLAVLALAGVAPAHAQAQLDADELGLDVEVGFAGQAARGRWLPVTVTLSPTRLFAGDVGVVVDTDTGQLVETRQVEVAAGSTKVYRFVSPPGHGVTVQVSGTGEEEGLNVRPDLGFADSYLVGVLGDTLPAQLPPVTSNPLGQRGVLVPVATGFVERSSRALDSLSALVITSQELAALSEETRRNVTSAVTAGLDLVVSPSADGALDLGLPWEAASAATTVQLDRDGTTQAVRTVEPGPLAWGMSAADLGWGEDTRPLVAAVNAGRGRVVVSGLALGEGPLGSDGGYWGRILQPNQSLGANQGQDGLSRLAQSAGEGLRSDSVSLPAIPIIATALLVYLLLVGPVNGVVLARMGRRELAWATIPAITLVFTGGAFFASSGAESATGLSGRAAYWLDGAGTQVQAAAIRAPRPGEHDLSFAGDDWDVAPATWSQVPAFVERTGGDTVMRMHLEALQVGTALAFRDLPADAPLGLDVDPTPGGARVTVTNRTSAAIEDVRVRAGTLVERLDTLAPGATATAEFQRDELPVLRDWHDEFAGLRAPDGTVTAPRSLEALLRWSVLDGNPGVVWATGTSSTDLGLAGPRADGARADDRGSFLAVGVTAGVPGTDTLPWEVDRQLLQVGFGEGWRPGPLAIEGRVEAVLRYRLPNEGAVAALVSSLDRGQLEGMFDAGVKGPPPPPQPLPAERCEQVEERDADGNLISVHEECVVETEVMPAQPLPECPPDASSCTFDGDTFEFCFPDGSCQAGSTAVPAQPEPQPGRPGGGSGGLEIWDPAASAWIPTADAFAEGSDTTRFVTPLGEVYVRAVGELHPFDFSGRGIAVLRGEA